MTSGLPWLATPAFGLIGTSEETLAREAVQPVEAGGTEGPPAQTVQLAVNELHPATQSELLRYRQLAQVHSAKYVKEVKELSEIEQVSYVERGTDMAPKEVLDLARRAQLASSGERKMLVESLGVEVETELNRIADAVKAGFFLNTPPVLRSLPIAAIALDLQIPHQ